MPHELSVLAKARGSDWKRLSLISPTGGRLSGIVMGLLMDAWCGWKQRKEVVVDLKTIYTAATEVEAEQRLAEFSLKWDAKFPTIAKSYRNHWVRVIPFFAHSLEIRKVIYPTNAIESLNMALRKVTKRAAHLIRSSAWFIWRMSSGSSVSNIRCSYRVAPADVIVWRLTRNWVCPNRADLSEVATFLKPCVLPWRTKQGEGVVYAVFSSCSA